jgi:hypothetical protein
MGASISIDTGLASCDNYFLPDSFRELSTIGEAVVARRDNGQYVDQ